MVQDSNYRLSGYVNTQYGVNIVLNDTIPSDAVSRVACIVNNDISSVYGTSYQTTTMQGTVFTCQVISSSVVRHNIGVKFDNTIISANSISFEFVEKSSLSFVSTSRQVEYWNQDLTVLVTLGKQVVDQSKVRCKQSDNEPMIVPVVIDSTSYSCKIASGNTTKTVNVSLWYESTPTVLLSDSNLAVSFVDSGAIRFQSDQPNAQIAGAAWSTKIWLNSTFLPWYLRNRIKCYSESGQVLASYQDLPLSLFTCTFTIAQPGVYNVSLYLDTFGNVDIPLSLNSVPIVSVGALSVSVMDPFAAFVGNSVPLRINVSTAVPFYSNNEVSYQCRYGSVAVPALLDSSMRSFTCALPSTNSIAAVDVGLYCITATQGTAVRMTGTAIFEFWERFSLQNVQPFVFPYMGVSDNLWLNVSVSTNQTLMSSALLKLFTISNQGSSFYNISQPSLNTIQVESIPKSNFNGNTELMDFTARVLSSPSGAYLDAAVNNISVVFYRLPLNFSLPLFSNFNIGQQILLNFRVPDSRAQQQFAIQMIPTFNVQQNAPQPIPCTFMPNTNAYCVFMSSIAVSHVPMIMNYSLQITRANNALASNLTIEPNVYMENITIVQESPFASDYMDYSSTPLRISFVANRNLNPTFSFGCNVVSASETKQVGASLFSEDHRNFSCLVQSNAKEEQMNISAYTVINGQKVVISNAEVHTTFAYFRFSPPIAELQNDTDLVLIMHNSSSIYSVPAKYRKWKFSTALSFSSTSASRNCSANTASGSITCRCKDLLHTPVVQYDIQSLSASLFVNDTFLLKVRHPLGVYKQNAIQSITPRATLVGSDVSLTIRFATSTLSIQPGLEYALFCQSQDSNLSVQASIMDGLSMNCSVKASLIPANTWNLTLVPMLRLASIDHTMNLTLSLPHNIQFFYLQKGAIMFNVNQPKILQTNVENTFPVTMNTFIGSNELKQYIRCKVGSQYIGTAFAHSSGSYSHTFNCSTSQAVGGVVNVSLWYDDNDNAFEIGSNSLELSYYTPAAILQLAPVATKVNRTITLSILTSFRTDIMYGSDQQFVLRGQGLSSANILNFTVSYGSSGIFTASVNYSTAETVIFSIWLSTKGNSIQVTPEAANFFFLDNFYLQPSYGLSSGNEQTFLPEYNSTDTFIYFVNDNSTYFSCILWNDQLNCTTPDVQGKYLPFNSYGLKLGSTNLGIDYVVYEKRNIQSITPRVFPLGIGNQKFNTSIILDLPLRIISGSIEVSINELTTNVQRIPIGPVPSNQTKFNISIAAMAELSYPVELYYQQSNILELRNSLKFTSTDRITFVSPRDSHLLATPLILTLVTSIFLIM
jgi:hypothetical protein